MNVAFSMSSATPVCPPTPRASCRLGVKERNRYRGRALRARWRLGLASALEARVRILADDDVTVLPRRSLTGCPCSKASRMLNSLRLRTERRRFFVFISIEREAFVGYCALVP